VFCIGVVCMCVHTRVDISRVDTYMDILRVDTLLSMFYLRCVLFTSVSTLSISIAATPYIDLNRTHLLSYTRVPYKRDDILQKRPVILRNLPIVATPYIVLDRTYLLCYTRVDILVGSLKK